VANTTTDLITYHNSLTLTYKQIMQEYTKSIIDNVFFQNLEYLHTYSDLVRFSNDMWNQRPEMFCVDYYGQSELSPIILTCNRLSTFFLFTVDNLKDSLIIAPRLENIIKLLSLIHD